MAEEPTLGYWDFRGIGEPIRLLLRYKKVKFVDKRYTYGTGSWPEAKANLGLDFPNLPYYIDGQVRITQSCAILRHLAKKYDLDGRSEEEHLRISVVEQQLVDFCWSLIRLCYGAQYESSKDEFVKNVPVQLGQYETFLGERKFLAGDNLTYVDFMAHEFFEFYMLFVPSTRRNFPRLNAFQDRFRNLPQLKEYFRSPNYKTFPLLVSFSKFGGQSEEPKTV